MDFKPQYSLSLLFKLDCVSDPFGNIRYVVILRNGVNKKLSFLFADLSSAIDFINSNFA